jgi:hypothetical protein
MLSAQSNYHLPGSKENSATVEFVSNMLQSEATQYLSSMRHWTSQASHNIESFLGAPFSVKIDNDLAPAQTKNAQSSSSAIASSMTHPIVNGLSLPSFNSGPSTSKTSSSKQSSGFFSSLSQSNKNSKHSSTNNNNSSEFNNSYDAGKRLKISFIFKSFGR